MAAYVAGDERAFEALFLRYGSRLQAMFRQGCTPAEAADLVQQTFLQLHRARNDFRPGAKVRPWLYTIALNLKRQLLRRSFRKAERVDVDEPGAQHASLAPTPEESLAATRVREAVSQLAAPARLVIEKHWFEGIPLEEIAREQGVKPGAMRVRAHRAYKALRVVLSDAQND